MFKHFIFKNGEKIVAEYTKGNMAELQALSCEIIQNQFHPTKGTDEQYVNPLVKVFETEK